jgi:hypothetical protein
MSTRLINPRAFGSSDGHWWEPRLSSGTFFDRVGLDILGFTTSTSTRAGFVLGILLFVPLLWPFCPGLPQLVLRLPGIGGNICLLGRVELSSNMLGAFSVLKIHIPIRKDANLYPGILISRIYPLLVRGDQPAGLFHTGWHAMQRRPNNRGLIW